jgi:DNA topoisomerase-3
LETGSTDLLTDFISNKNRRKFSAFLVRDPSGKVVFKFQEKKPKVAAAPATTKATAEAIVAPPAKKAAKKKPAKAPAKRKAA